jgi:spore coat protein CotH
MIAHKHITKIIAVVMAVAACLCLCAVAFSGEIAAAMGDTGISMEYETELFDTSSILTVNILMDEADWNDMLENATAEEYYQCDVEVNGTTFYRVAIRPKGNTSLTSIASDPTTDRYSFKLEFDHYVDGQSCFGLDKLILNNNYADATNMKEALIYDMYQYLGADASLYNYAKITVNGEYWGVYLALEAVEDSFMLRNYGAQSGKLYKPDSMNIGGGKDFGDFNADDMDFGNMTPPDTQGNTDQANSSVPSQTPDTVDPPQNRDSSGETSAEPSTDSGERPSMDFNFAGGKGGFSMSGGGADLNYTDDELDSYETIWDGEITTTTKTDHKRVVTALKNISEGNDLEDYMDIDNLLRYMAVHVFSVNEDSLSGTMAHNYYLYETGGKLNLIPWDYNLALGGMGSSNDATSVVNDAIDNAFSGTNFFDTLMEDETYHSQYYAYLQQLVSEYINGGGFDAFYERVRSQIDELVETDPTAFYSYDEYLTAVDTLYQVVKLRGESIQGQLDGTIPSTESTQRSSDALVDASTLDISVMGSMNTGGGGGGFGFNAPTNSENTSDTPDAAQDTSETQTAPDASAESENTPSSDFDPSQFGGKMPDGSDASQFGGEPPSGFDSSQFGGGNQDASDNTQQTDENAQNGGNGNSAGRPSMGNFPGSSGGTSAAASTENLILYGVSLLIFAAAMLFAGLYRRRPRKR